MYSEHNLYGMPLDLTKLQIPRNVKILNKSLTLDPTKI